MRLLFATNNAHKVGEVRAILPDHEVVTLADAGLDIDPEETEDSFEGNAILKARAVHALVGGWVMADDSGLEVDGLGGLPGVHSKRYSPEATSASNNAKLLEELAAGQDRTARFRCVVAVIDPDGKVQTVAGSCEGRIAESASGEGGFGYDPLFLPEGSQGRSLAEYSPDEKNAISHRGTAFRALTEVF